MTVLLLIVLTLIYYTVKWFAKWKESDCANTATGILVLVAVFAVSEGFVYSVQYIRGY